MTRLSKTFQISLLVLRLIGPPFSAKLRAANGDTYDGEWKNRKYHGSGECQTTHTHHHTPFPAALRDPAPCAPRAVAGGPRRALAALARDAGAAPV